MTVTALDAAWGSEVENGANKYPSDGSDWCGLFSGDVYRVAARFDISSIPATDTISNVAFQINVSSAGGATGTWSIGPYNGNGQGNPETDTAADMNTRCNVSADNYVAADTSFRTTGSKAFANLGAAAIADLEAARDAGTTFTIAIMEDGDDADICQFDEYTGGDPPTLTVTHAAGGGITSVNLERGRRGIGRGIMRGV